MHQKINTSEKRSTMICTVFDMYGAAQYGLVEISGVSSSEDGFYYCGSAEGNRRV